LIILGGGSGFIGTRLTNLLTDSGYDVKVISRMPGLNRINWTDIETKGVKGYQACINMAGQKKIKNKIKYYL
jgi:NAD dependent epimerase/dehydratase family enzyme